MNPSYTPTTHGPWGVTVANHLTDESALHTGLSPDLAQHTADGPFGCQSCGKEYTRLCDLNKHVKTHSRPFKCPVGDCPYYTSGWPTEKELNRHFNDKHSTEPTTFSCLWHGCNYSSKRESNCKQHMEKVHGYNYVRSRAGNREDDTSGPLGSTGAMFPAPVQSRDPLAPRTVPNLLLTPSPLEQCSPLDDASPLSVAGPVPYGPDIYIPWNSPVTRLRNNESFLQEFSQAYGPGTPVAVQDNEWLRVPVDPRLCNSGSSGTDTPETSSVAESSSSRDKMLRALPAITTPKTSPSVNSQVLTPVSEPSPILNQYSASREATTPQDTGGSRFHGHVATRGLGVTGHLNPFGKRHVGFDKEPGDDSDEGDEPPVKRSKTPGANDEDIGDPRMICPFRTAHPEIYDLNVQPKYFSCHTEHHNISTVVRHLGRPAHNLRVDNQRQAISSFHVADDGNGHPAAGLCKKCWRSFTDPEAFENHTNATCETVSRSKREKYQILLETFCRINQPGDHDASGDEDAEDAEGDSEAGAPASARSQLRRGDVVSRREYQALIDRVAALERMFATMMPHSTPRSLPQQGTVAQAFAPSPALPSQAFHYYDYESGPGPSRAPVGREPRTSIIGGMDTQALGAGDQAVPGFYHDTERAMAAGFRPRVPGRRTDSMSTVRRTSPLAAATPQPGGQPAAPRAVSDSAYGTEAAGGPPVAVAGNPSALGHLPTSSSRSSQNQDAFGAAAAAAEASQQQQQQQQQQSAAHTMMRDRWDQGVDAGSDMMQRMDFFNGQGPAEDICKYLDMDSQ